VRRHLAGKPAGASATGGPPGWSPLLYQAYARHDPDDGRLATLETARLLLDAGADPNDGRFWHALPTPFTVLTGVLGHGDHGQLATHGVDIVSPFTEQRSPRRGTPVETALLNGNRELADQLLALGARPPRLSAADAFVAAVLAGDTETALVELLEPLTTPEA